MLTVYPKTAEYMFFSSTREPFSRPDYMVGHKTNLNKFKKSEIISSIRSDKNCMKLEIKFCRKLEKKTKKCEIDNILLKKNKEIKRGN